MQTRIDDVQRWGAAGCIGASTWLAAPQLFAAEGSEGGSLEIFLVLVAVVAVAYLVAHVLLERIAERFGIVTGIEYIVLGAVIFRFLAAPLVPGAEGESTGAQVDLLIERLRPVLVLGTGSLGLMWGTHVDLREVGDLDRASFLPAIVASATTFAAVAGLPAAGIAYFYSLDKLTELAPLLVCAGAIAMVASDSPLRSLVSFLEAKGDAPRVAARVTTWCSSIAIVVFGLLFCFDHAGPVYPAAGPAPLQWLAVHVVVGLTLGLIFGTFLERDFADEKILTVIIGMVVFTSGLAHGLHLSPIFVNFILGAVLINTCRHGDHVRSRLESIKHPLYIVLFLFAGAKLELGVPVWAYMLAGPYLLLRMTGRWIGGMLSSPKIESLPNVPAFGRVLFAPGALSIAMAIDFEAIYAERGVQGPFFGTGQDVQAFYVALVVGIVISEVVAYATTRSWLIDAADVSISPGDATASGAGDGAPYEEAP